MRLFIIGNGFDVDHGLATRFKSFRSFLSNLACLHSIGNMFVDLRKGSATYGKWEGVLLSAENNQFMIPRGFAHGFVALSETAIFCYKCDELTIRKMGVE